MNRKQRRSFAKKQPLLLQTAEKFDSAMNRVKGLENATEMLTLLGGELGRCADAICALAQDIESLNKEMLGNHEAVLRLVAEVTSTDLAVCREIDAKYQKLVQEAKANDG